MSNPVVTTARYEPATSAPILLRRSALSYVVIMVEQTRLNVRPPRPKRGVLPAELLLDNKREPTPGGLEPTLFNLRYYPIQ